MKEPSTTMVSLGVEAAQDLDVVVELGAALDRAHLVLPGLALHEHERLAVDGLDGCRGHDERGAAVARRPRRGCARVAVMPGLEGAVLIGQHDARVEDVALGVDDGAELVDLALEDATGERDRA